MNNIVFTKSFSSPPLDRREILRYAGVRVESAEMNTLLDDCLEEISGKLSYKVCYCEFSVKTDNEKLDLGFATTYSASLSKRLCNCEKIILFCATVGLEMDRIIAKYSSISPVRSVVMQAIGSERVEALCDEFCAEISKGLDEGFKCQPRFSPGYGDLPLQLQREIFNVLKPQRNIGVVLNENMFMLPSKSVTAIIGIEKDN